MSFQLQQLLHLALSLVVVEVVVVCGEGGSGGGFAETERHH